MIAQVSTSRSGIDGAPLYAYINERHAIYLRKTKLEGGAPLDWAAHLNGGLETRRYSLDQLTDDPILQQYRFCNVFRELDSTTIWIRQYIRERFADHPNLWVMLAIARFINWPPMLAQLVDTAAWPTAADWRPEHLSEVWVRSAKATLAKKGGKVETGAYMIRAESDRSKPWYEWPKQKYLAEVVIGRLWTYERQWRRFLESGPTLSEVWVKLRQEYGWGGFMAYEVVTDLRHTRYLRDAADIMNWANAGPGALRGLNRLLGRHIKMTVNGPNYLMRDLLAQQDRLRAEWVPPLEMRDIEHSLCELDKYERVRLGEGKTRAKYVPGRGW